LCPCSDHWLMSQHDCPPGTWSLMPELLNQTICMPHASPSVSQVRTSSFVTLRYSCCSNVQYLITQWHSLLRLQGWVHQTTAIPTEVTRKVQVCLHGTVEAASGRRRCEKRHNQMTPALVKLYIINTPYNVDSTVYAEWGRPRAMLRMHY